MAYYLNLFSPETLSAFNKYGGNISGFRKNHDKVASKIHPGDKFICYVTKESRWVGILEVKSEKFFDDKPIFVSHDDPFVVRFKVKPIVWLNIENAIPIREREVWDQLSFTKGQGAQSNKWTGAIRGSLSRLREKDALLLIKMLYKQNKHKIKYDLKTDNKRNSKLKITTREIGNKFHKRTHALFEKMGFEVGLSDFNKEGPDIIINDPESIKKGATSLIVQCKRSEKNKTYPRIQSLIDEYSAKKKRYKASRALLFISGFKLRKNFNYSKTLSESGVAVVRDSLISYYEDLTNKIGKYAKYQFLTDIGIHSEFDKVKSFKALRVVQNNITFYIFTISPEWLLKSACVTRRVALGESAQEGYQRILSKKRVQEEIPKFLESKDWVLPNSIICVADNDGPLEYSNSQLTLPSKYGFLWVIDGQHRLYSFSNISNLIRNNSEIVAVVFDPSSFGSDRTAQQAQIFIDLNSNAKKVDKSLLLELNNFLGKDDPALMAVVNLSKKLPFKNLVSGYSNKKGTIQFATFVTNSAMKTLVKLLLKENKDDSTVVARSLEKLLETYFKVVAKVFSGMWGSSKYIVSENRGIRAFLKLFLKNFTENIKNKKKINFIQLKKRMLILKLGWPSFETNDLIGQYLGEGGADQLAEEWNAYLVGKPGQISGKFSHDLLETSIEKGESNNIEFKSSVWWDYGENKFIEEREKDILKTVAGFLNSKEGGDLFIGINDAGKVLGIEKDLDKCGKPTFGQKKDEFLRRLQTSLKDKLHRNGRLILLKRIKIILEEKDSKTICIIRVGPHDKAVYIDPGSEFYVRTGNETNKLIGPDMEEYIQDRFYKLT